MIFRNDTHAEQWAEAIDRAGALRDDDTINPYYGGSLFIITGIPGLYKRVEQYIHNNWIDFEPMLKMGLSTGESILVSLAGNFYNGGFFDSYTPSDIINHCDVGMVELAATATWLRKEKININTVFDLSFQKI